MSLTKQYLAYQHSGTFNIIASGRPNINFVIHNKVEGRYVVAGAAEDVIIWDLKLGQSVLKLIHERQEVTALRVSPDRIHIVVGYADGIVQIFEIEKQAVIASLALHKSAVSVLRFDLDGIRLVSGGLDTDIVVSDMVEQTGKQRLIGHNAPVTDVHFLDHINLNNVVVSSSKDTQIKFWNLETRSCFKTIVDNRSEVWGLALAADFLIAGTKENSMNVYRISVRNSKEDHVTAATGLIEGLSMDDDSTVSPIIVVNCGLVQRAGRGRCISLVTDKSKRVLSCHGTGDLIETFYFCSKDEARANLQKRLKKKNAEAVEESQSDLSLTDEIKRLPSIKVGCKIKSIDTLIGRNDELRVIVSCANNTLQMHSFDIKNKTSPQLLRSINQCGHQSEVRTVAFSSDSVAIASGSGDTVKVWSKESMQCLRTVETGYVLCLCFVPGDRHVLAGMKTGSLLIIDIGTGDIIEEIPAHKGELWSICLLPDLKGCVTGSNDTTVKTWKFELIESPNNEEGMTKPKVLSLMHENTLKLEESILAVKVSPNNKFLAAALLDSTIKIFFLDSFKFYLSLYGHKLPVLCMDTSYDSSLIVTGSADRNIKIWGLDFGDCHRSLLAHDDSVVAVQFIPKSHMFFSCGKDGKVKQWDGDSFVKIISLPGHIGEAYGLAVSPNARFLVSCGSDRCLRLFERTEEPIVLQDIQEEEREELENKTLATGDDNNIATLPGLRLPSRKTVGSEKCAELILECLDIIKSFDSSEKPEMHPLMVAYQVQNSDDFLVATLQRIRASNLEEALLLLPFSYVCDLLERMPRLSECRKDQTELICKVVMFLLKLHYKQIISNHVLLPVMGKISRNLENSVVELRDMIGMNFFSLVLLQRDIEEREGVELFRDAGKKKKQMDKKFRNRQAKRVHIQMS